MWEEGELVEKWVSENCNFPSWLGIFFIFFYFKNITCIWNEHEISSKYFSIWTWQVWLSVDDRCLTQTWRFCKMLLYGVWRGQLERSACDTYLTWTWYFRKVLTTCIWLNHNSFKEMLAIHISHKHEPAMKLWRINIIHLDEIISHINLRILKNVLITRIKLRT